MPSKVVFIIHNVRSAHNVGSILRSADGFAIDKIYLTGYTPYPQITGDSRLPHEAARAHRQIAKTALGAEQTVPLERQLDVVALISALKATGFAIVALEQAPGSVPLAAFRPGGPVAVIVGREVEGVEPEILKLVDHIVEIPMQGAKESLNVAVAAAIAMFCLKSSGGHLLQT